MGTKKSAGFTIIETMLFLGISGLLIVTFIAGAGASINVQRYRDATETLKSVIQQQYADLTSVQNARDNNWSCGTTALPSNSGSVVQDRGQSECLLLGKYVRIEDDKISIYRVLGYQLASAAAGDINSLKNNYALNVSRVETDSSTLEWGTEIASPVKFNGASITNPPASRKVGILVIRSPDSGRIYTFSNEGNAVPDDENINPVSLSSMLVAGNTIPGQGKILLCVDSTGLLANDDRAVYIGSFAAGASAVELRTNDYMLSESTGDAC
jgi:type II secretory pathway pseudopilin PulG